VIEHIALIVRVVGRGEGIGWMIRAGFGCTPHGARYCPAHDADSSQAIEPVSITHYARLRRLRLDALAETVRDDGMQDRLLLIGRHAMDRQQFTCQSRGEIGVVLRQVVPRRPPQVVEQRGHTHDKAVSIFPFGDIQRQPVHPVYMLPAVGKIVNAAETMLYFLIGAREDLRLARYCLHISENDPFILFSQFSNSLP
jgi:hypothetical protein